MSAITKGGARVTPGNRVPLPAIEAHNGTGVPSATRVAAAAGIEELDREPVLNIADAVENRMFVLNTAGARPDPTVPASPLIPIGWNVGDVPQER